jgi:O-antigen/teichoic acid export membrane protein
VLKFLRQVFSESAVYGVAAVLGQIAPFLLVPIFTRNLGQDGVGIVSLVNSIIAFLSILAALALDNSAHRFFWDSEDARDRAVTFATWFWMFLAASVFLGVLTVLLAAPVSVFANVPLARESLVLGGLSLPFRVSQNVLINWFRVKRLPVYAVIFGFGGTLVLLACSILFVAVYDRGVSGVFEAQLVSGVLVTLAGLPLMRAWGSPTLISLARLQAMLKYAAPLIPAGLAAWALNLSDRWILQFSLSSAEVGLYQVASTVAMGVGLPVLAFQQAWGPFALSIVNRPGVQRIYAVVMVSFALLACVAACLISVFSSEITVWLASGGFDSAASSVTYLALAQILTGLGVVAAIGLNIIKQNAPIAVALFVAAGVKIALTIVLLPLLGRDGAALAMLASQIVMTGMVFFAAQRAYPIPYLFLEVGVMLVGTGIFCVFARNFPSGTAEKPLVVIVFLLMVGAAVFWRVRRFVMIGSVSAVDSPPARRT